MKFDLVLGLLQVWDINGVNEVVQENSMDVKNSAKDVEDVKEYL